MIEVTLVGGPMDGETVEVEAGQLEVEKDGCTYRHREHDGFYCYVEGSPVRRGRVKADDTHGSRR